MNAAPPRKPAPVEELSRNPNDSGDDAPIGKPPSREPPRGHPQPEEPRREPPDQDPPISDPPSKLAVTRT